MKKARMIAAVLACCVLLSGCAAAGKMQRCTVVFEENAEVRMAHRVVEVMRGSDVTATLTIPCGRRIASVSAERWEATPLPQENGEDQRIRLTLHGINYPLLVRVTLEEDRVTRYHAGQGTGGEIVCEETSSRLRINSLRRQDAFSREGFMAVGWNTQASGEGTFIGFGSRMPDEAQLTDLYVHWLPCTPESAFTWEMRGGGAVVTGCSEQTDLVIPETLGGLEVTGIAAGAFGEADGRFLALPYTLEWVEAGAFSRVCAETIYLFDSLTRVSDAAFGDMQARTLRIGAVREPVWCGSYFDTLTEKMDRLRSVAGEKKIILLCGSSARFGYDSPALEAAFPGYRVVNMGVYAYASMLPQAEWIMSYLTEGDIVLSSPEMDAIDMQFFSERRMDRETFCMVESDYDLLSQLVLKDYAGVFDAFAAYQAQRMTMPARRYEDVPSYYDEDGVRRAELTYNRWGDYILRRENNPDDRLFGVKRAAFNPDHIRMQDWEGINAVYDAMQARGARVFFTYSPRSRRSVTPDTTPESLRALDEALRARLHAPVISSADTALWDALYFSGTDNHLSTEGAALHTAQVIADLKRAMEGTP